jgi:hypothetical protein
LTDNLTNSSHTIEIVSPESPIGDIAQEDNGSDIGDAYQPAKVSKENLE